MISVLRWFGRALFALGVLGLLACGIVIWIFTGWREKKLAELDAGSQVAQTAAGPVEYADFGTGPAVLVSHAAPGGYDQALAIGKSLADAGYRVIAPSRPGFLRTPLTSGLLFKEQARAFAALLDTLGIEEAAVIGFSTGSQVAQQFALQFPRRTRGLVLLSPITRPYVYNRLPDEIPLPTEDALVTTTGDMGAWLIVELAKRDPKGVVEGFSRMQASEEAAPKIVAATLEDPAELEFFRELAGAQAPMSPREVGTRNDIAMLRGLLPADYTKVEPPTLAVFGKDDSARRWADPAEFRKQMPQAKVLEIDEAGHVLWLGPNAHTMLNAVKAFLGALPTTAAPPDEQLPE